MVLVEMRESAYNKALDFIDEAKIGTKKTKLALCELEQCLKDCFESEESYEDEYYPEDEYTSGDVNNIDVAELNLRNRRGMHYRNAMRHSGMRMRRSGMGRYFY